MYNTYIHTHTHVIAFLAIGSQNLIMNELIIDKLALEYNESIDTWLIS
jgi:hypothetical protein